MTLWSGRFDTEPDPAAFDFGVSFGFDRALFEDDVTGSLAWAEALGACGVLAKEDAAAIRQGLESILEDGRRDPSFVSGSDEDIHSFVERKLIERIGDAGRRLHTGRSRNEQVSLDLRLYLRRRIPLLQQTLIHLISACADQAERVSYSQARENCQSRFTVMRETFSASAISMNSIPPKNRISTTCALRWSNCANRSNA